MGIFGARPDGSPKTGSLVAGTIGDALAQWAGMRPTFGPMLAQRQQQALELAAEQRQRADQWTMWQRQQEYDAGQPRLFQSGNDVVRIDPTSGAASLLYNGPDKPAEPPALQQNFNWFKGLSPEDQRIARPMLPGYGFTPEGVASYVGRAGAVANAQGAARVAHRAPARPGGIARAPKLPAGFILD